MAERKVTISVVIPTRNEGRVIRDTVARIRSDATTGPHSVEIIIADAESTDDTVAKCEDLVDVVVHQADTGSTGIAGGRNCGAAAAHGAILLHTDADVRIPDLQALIARVEEIFRDPDVVAATTRIRVYPEEERPSDIIAHWIFNTAIRASLRLGGLFGKGECQIVRRSAFNEIGGYRTDIAVAEDCNLFVRLSNVGKIIYLQDHVVFHSPRRFREYGYVRTFAYYFREFFFLATFNRSYLKSWEPVR